MLRDDGEGHGGGDYRAQQQSGADQDRQIAIAAARSRAARRKAAGVQDDSGDQAPAANGSQAKTHHDSHGHDSENDRPDLLRKIARIVTGDEPLPPRGRIFKAFDKTASWLQGGRVYWLGRRPPNSLLSLSGAASAYGLGSDLGFSFDLTTATSQSGVEKKHAASGSDSADAGTTSSAFAAFGTPETSSETDSAKKPAAGSGSVTPSQATSSAKMIASSGAAAASEDLGLRSSSVETSSLDGGTIITDAPAASIASLDATVALSATSDALAAPEALAAPAAAAAAAAPPNKIALENQKQGNPVSEWGVDGEAASDPTSRVSPPRSAANVGQTVDFKIATDSTHYRIDIYRLGYYGGDGARKVATIDKTLTTAQVQPHPIVDMSLGLIDCGNWSVSASWEIPADAVSGVYFAKLVREDGTEGAEP